MCWTQKFSFSRDPVILDLKLQLADFYPGIYGILVKSHTKGEIFSKIRKIARFCKKI